MNHKYIVGGIGFNTKKSIIEHTKSVLQKYPLHTPIIGSDFNFICDLLSTWHPNATQKIGCGIAELFVAPALYNSRCFFLRRLDGSETDFSYLKCFVPNERSDKLRDLKSACRTSINMDVQNFKLHYFSEFSDSDGLIRCPFTQEKVSFFNCHVDHAPPNTFSSIFDEWIKLFNVDFERVELIGYDDGEMKKVFVNKNLERSFVEFHKSKMNLRITSSWGNLVGSRMEAKKMLKSGDDNC